MKRLAEFVDGVPSVGQTFDMCICFTLGETRARNVFEKYAPGAPLKLLFSEQGGDATISATNLSYFSSCGFRDVDEISFREVCRTNGFSSVLIDISCMSRGVMAAVVQTLFAEARTEVQLTFVYSHGAFVPPSSSTGLNQEIEPVHENCAGWPVSQAAPTSLVIGLGYEPSKAEGASEFLDPSEQWAFIPTSKIPQYLVALTRNNANFIRRLEKINRTVKYNVHQPSETFGLIELVVTDLLTRSNPILLPFGPKIFFALCLLSGLIHPEVGVWHVRERHGAGDAVNVDASGNEIGFMVAFAAPAYS